MTQTGRLDSSRGQGIDPTRMMPGATPRSLLSKGALKQAGDVTLAMSYDKWMERTKLNWRHPRSSLLKKVDDAFKAYDTEVARVNKGGTNPRVHACTVDLRNALSDWCLWKNVEGKGWRKSERNKDHVVEELYNSLFQLGAVIYEASHRVDQAALKEILDGQRTAAMRLLLGQEVELKFLIAAKKTVEAIRNAAGAKAVATKALSTAKETYNAGNLVLDAKQAYSNVKQTVSTFSASTETADGQNSMAFAEFIKVCIPDKIGTLSRDAILQEILGDTFAGVVQAAIPFWGCAKNGFKAVNHWKNTAATLWDRRTIGHNKVYFDTSLTDTGAALAALDAELVRMAEHNAKMAGLFTVAATAQGAAVMLDGGVASGPAIEAAKRVALMMEKIYILGRGIREMLAANRLLADPTTLDDRIFTDCPLVGCYFLRCTELSSLISLKSFGKDGWMREVETYKKKVDTARDRAGGIMRDSFFAIDGLVQYAAKPGIMHKWKMKQYFVQRIF